MRTQLLLLAAGLASISSSAQSLCQTAFSPFQKGAKMEYSHYDKKDKLATVVRQEVVSVRTSGDSTIAAMRSQISDEKDKELFNGAFEVACVGGNLYVDMRRMIGGEQAAALQNMDMSFEGTPLLYASDLAVGQALPDGALKMTMSSGGINLVSFNMNVRNRKVEARESVTVPAGTYNAYKITYDFESRGLFGRTLRMIEWMAPGVGLVKSESYDKKGKLESRSELSKFSK